MGHTGISWHASKQALGPRVLRVGMGGMTLRYCNAIKSQVRVREI